MGFAGLTASETARRCGPVWRSSWRSKVSSRTEVRVLNLSRHLNSPGGPSLCFVAKVRQISRVPKYASKSFRTPRIRQGPSRCLRGESDKAPLFLRVLNLSRHLNSPGGPSLSLAAKARFAVALTQGALVGALVKNCLSFCRVLFCAVLRHWTERHHALRIERR